MSVKVVDASALAALLFGEPRAEEVASRLSGGKLVAPTLLRYEIASVCLKKLRRHPHRREALLRAHALLDRIALHEVAVPMAEVAGLAETEPLTVYDAAYVWLARSLRGELVTLDAGLEAAWKASIPERPPGAPES